MEKNPRSLPTRQLVTMGILIAAGVVLSFIEFPLLPAAPYLKYDPSGIAALIATLVFGPLSGSVVGAAIALIHGSSSGPIGVVMNALAFVSTALVTGLIYRAHKTKRGAVAALAGGGLAGTVASIAANFIALPLYAGMSTQAVAALVLPVLLPFNLIKVTLNAAIVFVIYKRLRTIIRR